MHKAELALRLNLWRQSVILNLRRRFFIFYLFFMHWCWELVKVWLVLIGNVTRASCWVLKTLSLEKCWSTLPLLHWVSIDWHSLGWLIPFSVVSLRSHAHDSTLRSSLGQDYKGYVAKDKDIYIVSY